MRLYYGMTVYPSLERSYSKSSFMCIKPAFYKKNLICNFCEYFYPHNVLKKKCPVWYVLNYHSLFCPINSDPLNSVGCILMNSLLDRVNTNSMGLNVDGYFMGLKIQKYCMGFIVIIRKKSSMPSIHMKLQTWLGFENSMVHPGVMDLVTYTHVIWVKFHGLRRRKS